MFPSLDPIVIVGAGLAGLVAAGELRAQGHEVIVLEAAGVVGGRMATESLGEARFDSGAQFFTVREARFDRVVEKWIEAGVTAVWSDGFARASGRTRPDGHPRYRGVPDMAGIPNYLARGLDVRLNQIVKSAAVVGERWRLALEGGEVLNGRALILTPPLPLSLSLLQKGDVSLPQGIADELEGVHYDPCLALLLELERPSGLPAPGAVQLHGEPLAFIADNTQKGVSADSYAVTIHAGPRFSEEYWSAEDDLVAQMLLDEASFWIKAPQKGWRIRRWLHSIPTAVVKRRAVHITGLPPLVLAGDVFGGPRVEGAVLSGMAAAGVIANSQ